MQDMTNIFKILHGSENSIKVLLPTIKKKNKLKSTKEYSGDRIKNEALFQVIIY